MLNITNYIVPALLLFAILLALIKKKSPYDCFIKGAREGLSLAKEVFPSIMSMLLAVSILRSCGIVEDLGNLLGIAIPNGSFFAELTPMLLFRPLSGSASMAVLSNACALNGPDSLVCRTMSTIQGSTDTTFYVIALYFGTIGIKKWRHSLTAGLIADAVGMTIAVILAIIVFS